MYLIKQFGYFFIGLPCISIEISFYFSSLTEKEYKHLPSIPKCLLSSYFYVFTESKILFFIKVLTYFLRLLKKRVSKCGKVLFPALTRKFTTVSCERNDPSFKNQLPIYHE